MWGEPGRSCSRAAPDASIFMLTERPAKRSFWTGSGRALLNIWSRTRSCRTSWWGFARLRGESATSARIAGHLLLSVRTHDVLGLRVLGLRALRVDAVKLGLEPADRVLALAALAL